MEAMVAIHGYRGGAEKTSKAVKARYARWGGIPRFVIQQLGKKD